MILKQTYFAFVNGIKWGNRIIGFQCFFSFFICLQTKKSKSLTIHKSECTFIKLLKCTLSRCLSYCSRSVSDSRSEELPQSPPKTPSVSSSARTLLEHSREIFRIGIEFVGLFFPILKNWNKNCQTDVQFFLAFLLLHISYGIHNVKNGDELS